MGRKTKFTSPLPVFGIDYSKPGEYVAARATKDCQNVYVRRSLILKRPGTESCGLSLAERVQLMVELEKGNGTTYFMRIGVTKFEELNKASLIWTSRASAPLTGQVIDQISAASPLLAGDRILVYTNGKDAIRKFVGGGNDAILGGAPPIAKFVFAYGNYLLLFNITTGGNRFPWRAQWCDTGAPETWGSGNAGSQELLEDSNDITGVGYYGRNFTVHKESALYVGYLTNSTNVFAFERRETGVGAVANKTILGLPTGEQLFLSREGLHIFNGITAPLIEAPINDELRDFLNPEAAYKSWGIVIKELDEAWIGVPVGSDSEPSTIYKFNYVTRQVYKDKRPNCTSVSQYKNTQGQLAWDSLPSTWDSWVGPWDNIALATLNPIYVFGFTDGRTLKQNTGSSDNGTAIEARWDSKDITSMDFPDVGEADVLMRWSEIRIWAKGSGSITLYYTLDGGTTFNLLGSMPLQADFPADNTPQRLWLDKKSVRMGIRIVHNEDNKIFYLKNFAILAVPGEGAGH